MLLAAVLQAEALLEGAGAGVPVEEGVVLEALLVHAFLAARVEQAHGCRVQKNDLVAMPYLGFCTYVQLVQLSARLVRIRQKWQSSWERLRNFKKKSTKHSF